jgi:hypothetical protein
MRLLARLRALPGRPGGLRAGLAVTAVALLAQTDLSQTQQLASDLANAMFPLVTAMLMILVPIIAFKSLAKSILDKI